MKRIMIIASFAVSAAVWPAQQTVTLSVPGMTCAICPVTIKKALLKLDGVIDVKSNLGKRETTVIYDDVKVKVATMTRATKEAGFPSTFAGTKP